MKSGIPNTARRQNQGLAYMIKSISTFDKLRETLLTLKEDLAVRSERDKIKDETILRLTSRMDDLERGREDEIRIDLIKSIIVFYDSLERFQKKYAIIDNEAFQKDLEFLKSEIIDVLLFNNHVEPIENDQTGAFNGNLQVAKGIFEVDKPELDNNVFSIEKTGFRYKDKIIRKQEVIKCRFNTPHN